AAPFQPANMNERSALIRRCLACVLGAALAPLGAAQATELAIAVPPPGLATSSAVSPLVNLPPAVSARAKARAASGPSPAALDVSAAELRWRTTLDAFAEQGRQARPQAGGVLFVGSSSIRLWDNLEAAFQQHPVVIKRGFGGSRLADCVAFIDRLVLP